MTDHSIPTKAAASVERDKGSFKQLVKTFGGLNLREITPSKIAEHKSLRRQHGVKPGTIAKELQLLRNALNIAFREWEWIEATPFSRVKIEMPNNMKERWLTLDEEALLLGECPEWLKALQPLPPEPFPFYHEGRRKVHRDGHVEIDKSYYSVPPEYLGREVWVRWDSRLVRIFNVQFGQIAVHPRVEPGRFDTSRFHLADQKISAVERGAEYMLLKTISIGAEASRWAKAMLDARGIEGIRVLQGFIHLAREYPSHAINMASKTALEAGMFRLRPLRELVRRNADQRELEFAESHPIIRPLSEYQELLTVSFKRSDNEPAT